MTWTRNQLAKPSRFVCTTHLHLVTLIILNKAMLFLFNVNEAVARNGITGSVSYYCGLTNHLSWTKLLFFLQKRFCRAIWFCFDTRTPAGVANFNTLVDNRDVNFRVTFLVTFARFTVIGFKIVTTPFIYGLAILPYLFSS